MITDGVSSSLVSIILASKFCVSIATVTLIEILSVMSIGNVYINTIACTCNSVLAMGY